MGVELISTGGTAAALRAEGLPVKDVAELTGFPEMLDGRVKTLHPNVHGGLLLVRGSAEHEKQAAAHGIAPIDLLVVNLYPFEATVAKGAAFEECIENIDIGGPALIRARGEEPCGGDGRRRAGGLRARTAGNARKRRRHDAQFAQETRRKGLCPHRSLRCRHQQLVCGETGRGGARVARVRGQARASRCAMARTRINRAAFYVSGDARPGVATAVQHQGKELSYNNLNDTDAALRAGGRAWPARSRPSPSSSTPIPAGRRRRRRSRRPTSRRCAATPVSAFGGIVALSGTIDAAAAEEITKIFTEVVIAPDATAEAKAIFAGKKNLRLLTAGGLPDPRAAGVVVRSLAGGLLVQSRDNGVVIGAPISRS